MITDEEKQLVAPRIDTLGSCEREEGCAIIHAVLRICKHVTKKHPISTVMIYVKRDNDLNLVFF